MRCRRMMFPANIWIKSSEQADSCRKGSKRNPGSFGPGAKAPVWFARPLQRSLIPWLVLPRHVRSASHPTVPTRVIASVIAAGGCK